MREFSFFARKAHFFEKKCAASLKTKIFCKSRKLAHLTIGMNTDIDILLNFLDRTGPEVTARELTSPNAATTAALERFARGQCDPRERASMCETLQKNPSWIRIVAARVKAQRAS